MEKYRAKFLPEKKYARKKGGYSVGGYNSQEECHAAFAAMINVLDDQVGEIIDKVHELGIAENTLIIFTSDNGPGKEGGADPDILTAMVPLRATKETFMREGFAFP